MSDIRTPLLLCLALALLGCGPATPVEHPDEADPEPTVALSAELERTLSALPAASQGLLYTPDLEAFAARLAAGDGLERVWAATLGYICHDLIDALVAHAGDPATLTSYGLDVHRPAGIASVDPFSLESVLFFSIADDDAFQKLLDDTATATASTVERRTAAGGVRVDVLTTSSQHVYVLRRAELGFVFMCPYWRELCLEKVDELAAVTAASSLVAQPDIVAELMAAEQRATTSPDAPLLAGALVQRARGRAIVRSLGHQLQDNTRRQQELTIQLTRQPPAPNSHDYRRDELDNLRARQKELEGQLALQTDYVQNLYDAVGSLRTELDMTAGLGHIEARGAPEPSALTASVLDTGRPGPERFARALTPDPLGVVWVDVDLAAWLEQDARAHAVAYDTPLGNFQDYLAWMTGQDIHALSEQLDGQIGLAFTRPEVPTEPSAMAWLETAHAHLALGLRDPAITRDWIESLRRDPAVALLLRPRGDDGYQLITVVWKPLTLTFIDHMLVVSSDPEFVDRYRTQSDGGFLAASPQRVVDALTNPTTFFHAQLDIALLGELVALDRVPGPVADETADRDAAYRQWRTDWRARLDARWAELFEVTRGAVDAVGTMQLSMRYDETGELVLRLDQLSTVGDNARFFDTLATFVERGIEVGQALRALRRERTDALTRFDGGAP